MSQRPAPPRAPPSSAVAALVIAAATLLAYANAFRGELVLDDWSSIRDGAVIRDFASFAPGGLAYRVYPTRWLTYLTFAANYALGGLDVVGYHAVNVAIHLANALLVRALVVVAFRTPRLARSALAGAAPELALAAALLFATHPLQTGAVTYVVQRLASLATLLYLLAVVLYARWRVAPAAASPWRRAAGSLPALAAAGLAMRTKEIAFTLPFAIALCEALFLEGSVRRRIALVLPFAATALLVPAALLGLDRPVGDLLASAQDATKVETTMARGDYLLTQLGVVASYLQLLVVPVGQNVDHDPPVARSLLEPRVLAALALLGALVAVAVVLVRRSGPRAARPLDPAARLVSFGIAWFFLGLSVESSVIPIADLMFEHRVYLPSAGFFVAVVAAGALLARRVTAAPGRLALRAAAALAIVLAAATLHRNRVWASSLALWSDAVEKSPRKTRPHSNVALALSAQGREAEALPHFEAVVRLDPLHVSGMNNLAVCLDRLGRTDEAVRWLEHALGLKPDHAETWFNLGSIRMDQRRDAEAAVLLRRAVALDPGYVQAYANLAGALNQLGRPDETVRLVEGREALLAQSAEASFNLGVAYVLLGDAAGVERALAALARLSPEHAARLAAYVRAQPGR